MKLRTAIYFALVWIVLLTGGCPPSSNGPPTNKVMLPPDIAGTWKARKGPWKIVLSPDGTVASTVIEMGTVEVRPNKTTRVKMKDGQFSTYKAGDCIVEYTPATRELYVSVEMEQIHVVYLDNVIDGNSIDRFAGPVAQDGKTWIADWIKIFDYGPRFPQDPNYVYQGPMTFEKIGD